MVVASVQNVVYIPVFSDYFSPQPAITVVAVEKPYVSNIQVGFKEYTDSYANECKLILISKIFVDDSFDNYTNIIVEFINTSTGDTTYSGIVPKDQLNIGIPCYEWKKAWGHAQFQINVYCSSDHPEKIIYKNTIIKDEITYYLIYEHTELVYV